MPPPLPAVSPTARRTTLLTVAGIAALVVVVVVVSVLVVTARTRGPLTGEWYGTLGIGPPAPPTPIMNGAPSIQVVDVEVFLHMQQTGSTVAGAGTLCLRWSARGEPPVQGPVTVAGTATDARATLHWSSSGASLSTMLLGSTNVSLEATRSGGELALSGANARSTYRALLHQGTERQYASACAQLPPLAER